MKIDFNTRYNEKEFEALCQEAMRLGLDGLVMSGLNENRLLQYKSARVFPAQELEWVAALEHNNYRSLDDFEANKRASDMTKVYRGKLLALLPSSKPFLVNPDNRLYPLLEQIKHNGGVSIALQDDTNWPVTLTMSDRKKLYPFDAIRIRPYNIHDVNSELQFAPVSVAGSGASDLNKGAYTVYEKPIQTQEELIQAIKRRTKTELYVHNNGSSIRIENTVKPLKVVIDPKKIERLRRSI